MKPEADYYGDSPIALSRVCNTGSEIAIIALIASECVPALAFAVFRVLRALLFSPWFYKNRHNCLNCQ